MVNALFFKSTRVHKYLVYPTLLFRHQQNHLLFHLQYNFKHTMEKLFKSTDASPLTYILAKYNSKTVFFKLFPNTANLFSERQNLKMVWKPIWKMVFSKKTTSNTLQSVIANQPESKSYRNHHSSRHQPSPPDQSQSNHALPPLST